MRLPNWRFNNAENQPDAQTRQMQESAWPDMFANLQSAYAELTNAQFELERRSAEIAETRDLVQQIVSSMTEALLLTDRAGRVIRANPAAAELLGCSEDDILGRPLAAVCGTEEIPATPWKLMEATKEGRIAAVNVTVTKANGEQVPVSFSLTLMHDKQEKITGVLAVARNMSEQQELIDNLVAARTRFQELLEFAPDAIILANQDGNIVLVNSQTEKMFGFNRESLLGQSVEMLVPERYRQEYGEKTANATNLEDWPERPAQARTVAPEPAVSTNVPPAAESVVAAPLATEPLPETEIVDLSATPKVVKAEVRSTVSKSAAHAKAHPSVTTNAATNAAENGQTASGPSPQANLNGQPPLNDQEAFFNEATTLDAAAIALRNSDEKAQQIEFYVVDCNGREFPVEITQRPILTEEGLLLMSVIRDISERKRIQEELHVSEERYRALAETAQDVILSINEQWTILFANSAIESVLGYTLADIYGHSADWLLPQASQAFQIARMHNPDANSFRLEITEQRKDESEVLLEIVTGEFEQEGEKFFTWFVRDITERRRIEGQLVESEQRYQNIAETAAEVILTVDANGILQFVNPAVENTFGYEPEALIGQSLGLLVPSVCPPVYVAGEPAVNAFSTEWLNRNGAETVALHRDGRELAVEVSFSEFTRENARYYTGIIRDISERKRIEAQLLESEQRYRNVVESATELIVTLAESGEIEFTNSAIGRLFRYSHEEIIGRNISELIPVYNEAFLTAELRAQSAQVLADQAAPHPLAFSEVEVVGKRKDGEEILLDFSFNEFTRNGKRYFTGIIRDITERKEAEAALRLNKRALEASSFPILIADAAQPELPLIYVNPAFERVTGYAPADALGRNCRFLQGEDRDQPGLLELRAALKAGRDCTVLLRNYKKDGSLFFNELTVSPVFDEAGKLTHFIGFEHDVTARLKQDEALRQANALQNAIVSSAGSSIIATDANGLIVLFNPTAEKLLGYTAAEMVGQQTPVSLHDPQEIAARAQELSLELQQPVTSDFEALVIKSRLNLNNESEWNYLRKDGTQVPVSLAVTAFRDSAGAITGYLAIATDITHLKLVQEHKTRQAALRVSVTNALNEPESEIQPILQRCAAAIAEYLNGAQTHIWVANETNATLNLQATAGAPSPLLLANQRPKEVDWVAAHRAIHVATDVTKDPLFGTTSPVSEAGFHAFAGYPLLTGERLLGVVTIYKQRSIDTETLTALGSVVDMLALGIERLRAEAARTALLEREQSARREAEEASRLKDDFLAMISHELRAPLTAILGWAQMLRSGGLDQTAAERALLTIERNAKSQAHLVGDLLDASRIATGKLRLEKRPIELMQLIESAIDAVRPSVEAKQLRLQIVMEPWVGPFVGDPERMKQIVWNLLSNSVKFTPPNGLIEIRLEKLENKALLIVSDTGQGIEPEFLPYIFDRFRQADSSSKRQQGGLGLGLAIVKYLVEMHGGAIYAYSEGKGLGSNFMVTLPLGDEEKPVEKQLWQQSLTTQEAKGGGTLRGVRVLVVDDERDTREILAVMLARFGTEVRMAGSVAEGFETFQAWRPDLMVSDIGMPEADGYVLIGKVRGLSADAGGNTPVIALTAFASTQDRQRTSEAGFNHHLAKPVEPVELARVVARTLGRSEVGIEL